MGRLSVWVLLGLTLFAATCNDVLGSSSADVGPTETECRPYIEKAINQLKTGETLETEANAANDPDSEEEEHMQQDQPPDDSNDDDDDDDDDDDGGGGGGTMKLQEQRLPSEMDIDGDGIPNEEDSDIDGDVIPNEQDDDMDGDGILNVHDSDMDGDIIPNEKDIDMDGDGVLNVHDKDIDGDGVPNVDDSDLDGDGVPNSQDVDMDGDGILNEVDEDKDGDGIFNKEDSDVDGDGIPNHEDDDVDGDGVPNAEDIDMDGDGVPNAEDNDLDGDGVLNDQDNDLDGDGIPNDQDDDIDGDGVNNDDDEDIDGDGVPNDDDEDIDGDGVPNHQDDDIDGDGVPNDEDGDMDGDGVPNDEDNDIDGDGVLNEDDDDIDGDGIPNDRDNDIDGDGIPNENDNDIDGDGIPNDVDDDIDGDGVNNDEDGDIDGDGVPNDEDNDIDGDGILNEDDGDIDGDGIANDDDNDLDGDGIPNDVDNDIDGDGIPNNQDDDIDGDGIHNEHDNDIDGDGVANTDDEDIDGDGIHNVEDDDVDGDGVSNARDDDIDGDGILNIHEARGEDDAKGRAEQGEEKILLRKVREVDASTDGIVKKPSVAANANDIDGDGILDHEDDDKDGDGVPDHQDDDIDGDGILNEHDDDKDGDGIPNELDKGSASEEEKDDDDDDNDDDDTMPEDELLWEGEIPETLRSHEHITELLQLDEESSAKEKALDRIAEIILRDIKRIYENAIKPLEMMYKYRDLSNRHFSDPEIFSKPLLLFMGPWSGGKSTIINYLTNNDYTQHSLRTGAEPSPAYFNILMWGNETEILDGTQLAADYTFSGLQKFGEGLEDRLRGLKMSNKLLEKVNIVEIPGILEVRKQVARLFPFNDACQWFIDRADIILLVYDPAKLDVGPETEAILDQLKGREYQTRILLNKADTVKPEELLRVQSALIWNISPMMSSAQPPLLYTTSLWSHPYQDGAPTRLLMAQERALLRDLRTAIDKRIEHKIASARRFAVRVRNHAKMVDCYLNTYYNHKTLFGNKKRIADNIIENPQDFHIYEGLSTLTNISRYDLPDPEVYRDFFRLHPLFEFKKLSETCTYFRGCPISKLDVAIAYDLPELAGKYKKMAEHALADNDAKHERTMDGHRPTEKTAAVGASHGQREKNKS